MTVIYDSISLSEIGDDSDDDISVDDDTTNEIVQVEQIVQRTVEVLEHESTPYSVVTSPKTKKKLFTTSTFPFSRKGNKRKEKNKNLKTSPSLVTASGVKSFEGLPQLSVPLDDEEDVDWNQLFQLREKNHEAQELIFTYAPKNFDPLSSGFYLPRNGKPAYYDEENNLELHTEVDTTRDHRKSVSRNHKENERKKIQPLVQVSAKKRNTGSNYQQVLQRAKQLTQVTTTSQKDPAPDSTLALQRTKELPQVPKTSKKDPGSDTTLVLRRTKELTQAPKSSTKNPGSDTSSPRRRGDSSELSNVFLNTIFTDSKTQHPDSPYRRVSTERAPQERVTVETKDAEPSFCSDRWRDVHRKDISSTFNARTMNDSKKTMIRSLSAPKSRDVSDTNHTLRKKSNSRDEEDSNDDEDDGSIPLIKAKSFDSRLIRKESNSLNVDTAHPRSPITISHTTWTSTKSSSKNMVDEFLPHPKQKQPIYYSNTNRGIPEYSSIPTSSRSKADSPNTFERTENYLSSQRTFINDSRMESQRTVRGRSEYSSSFSSSQNVSLDPKEMNSNYTRAYRSSHRSTSCDAPIYHDTSTPYVSNMTKHRKGKDSRDEECSQGLVSSCKQRLVHRMDEKDEDEYMSVSSLKSTTTSTSTATSYCTSSTNSTTSHWNHGKETNQKKNDYEYDNHSTNHYSTNPNVTRTRNMNTVGSYDSSPSSLSMEGYRKKYSIVFRRKGEEEQYGIPEDEKQEEESNKIRIQENVGAGMSSSSPSLIMFHDRSMTKPKGEVEEEYPYDEKKYDKMKMNEQKRGMDRTKLARKLHRERLVLKSILS